MLTFFSNRLHELTRLSIGRHNGHTGPLCTAKNDPFWERLWRRLPRPRVSNQRRSLHQRWRENPVAVINRLLLALVILLTAAAPLFLWYDATALASRIQTPGPKRLSDKTTEVLPPAKKSYAKVAARRPYFRLNVRETTAEPRTPLNAAEVPGLTTRYTLLGILMGEVPRAIVQENSTNTSMFLTRGQHLDGYLVQEIFSDRVLLERDGDLINLRM